MTKLFNIFIVASILVASALVNVTLYKCVHDGDLCVTKSCCPSEKVGESCCQDKDTSEINGDQCCEEFKIIQETVFNDVNLTKAKSPENFKFFAEFITKSLLKKDLIFQDEARGPPLDINSFSSADSPTYISNCSFLC